MIEFKEGRYYVCAWYFENCYVGMAKGSEDEIFVKTHAAIFLLAAGAVSPLDTVMVKGDFQKLHEAMAKRPWAHLKVDPRQSLAE